MAQVQWRGFSAGFGQADGNWAFLGRGKLKVWDGSGDKIGGENPGKTLGKHTQ